jgi:hypothetical protein
MLDSSRRLRMDDRMHSDSQDTACVRLGSEPKPIVDAPRDTPGADALRHSLDDVEQRRDDLSRQRQVVTYCFHGPELGEGMAAAFRMMGIDAPLP